MFAAVADVADGLTGDVANTNTPERAVVTEPAGLRLTVAPTKKPRWNAPLSTCLCSRSVPISQGYAGFTAIFGPV